MEVGVEAVTEDNSAGSRDLIGKSDRVGPLSRPANNSARRPAFYLLLLYVSCGTRHACANQRSATKALQAESRFQGRFRQLYDALLEG
jgi:hypothetical protein